MPERSRYLESVSSRSLGHRAPLMWLVLPMMAGLMLGQWLDGPDPLWLLMGAAVFALTALFTAGRVEVWAGAIVLALVIAGAASYGLHRMRLPEWDLRPAREATLRLRIDRVFPASDARKVSGLAAVLESDAPMSELAGQRIYFSLALARGELPPLRTAEIRAIGVLAVLPKLPPLNSFDGYLARAGINFRLQRGRVLTLEQKPTAYAQFRARSVERFKAILSLGISAKRPELAALLRAMMLGETHELSEEQRDLFRQSGTMHLFAISGMNIAVIAGALQVALTLPLRRWPLVQFAVGAAVLWLFVDITGAAPSAVRAFSMAVFLQVALAWWKPANILSALTASALMVVVLAPLQFFSASFVMSYGILAALLLLGLPLGEAWAVTWNRARDLPKAAWRWWHHASDLACRWLAAALAAGVATTLVGLLTGVLYFGMLTPGAVVTNLVLIPIASGVTLSGFASLVLGLLGWNGGAAFCNHASALMLLGIEHAVRRSVSVPGAVVPAHFTTSWVGGMALTILGVALLAGYGLGWRRTWGGFWPPFAIVALVLIFGLQFQ